MKVTGPVIAGRDRYPATPSPRLSFLLSPVDAALPMHTALTPDDIVHVSSIQVPSSALLAVIIDPPAVSLSTVETKPLPVLVLSISEGNSTLVRPVTVCLVSPFFILILFVELVVLHCRDVIVTILAF